MTPDNQRQFRQNKKSLDSRNHLDRAFPSEYASVKQEVRTARLQIKDYNRQIKALRAGANPPNAPHLNMPGAGNVSYQTEDRIRSLKYQRNQTRLNTFEKVNAQTQQASPERQAQMQGAARKELQKGMSQQARDKQNSTRLEPGTASVNRAQDRFFSKYQATQPTQQRQDLPREAFQPQTPAQNAAPTPPDADKGSPASIRYSLTVNYNKSVEPAKPEATKTEAQKDMPEGKSSDISAADHFLSSSRACGQLPLVGCPIINTFIYSSICTVMKLRTGSGKLSRRSSLARSRTAA